MGASRDALNRLRGVVSQAERNGSLPPQLAQGFWDVAGRSEDELHGRTNGRSAATPTYVAPVNPGREVTIRLRVTGGALPDGAATRVADALRAVAREGGLEIVPGSVRVDG